jgi:site-specific recombinase XerD
MRAYRGEVDRLSQFFAVKHGLVDLGEFAQEHWVDYLEELRKVRKHVVTSRKASLSPSSTSQAIRILRAFLRWARDEGLLSWVPREEHSAVMSGASLRAPLVNLALPEGIHPAIVELLSEMPPTDIPLEDLRARIAIGMAYWVGLKTSEIAALRVSNLKPGRSSFEVRHPEDNSKSVAPPILAACWMRYRSLREGDGKTLTARSPVIAAVGTDDPVSAWTIWSTIGRKLAALTGAQGQSAQSLRRCRMLEMSQSYAADLERLAVYARRTTVDFGLSVPSKSGESVHVE